MNLNVNATSRASPTPRRLRRSAWADLPPQISSAVNVHLFFLPFMHLPNASNNVSSASNGGNSSLLVHSEFLIITQPYGRLLNDNMNPIVHLVNWQPTSSEMGCPTDFVPGLTRRSPCRSHLTCTSRFPSQLSGSAKVLSIHEQDYE